jgi:hypothetical protein
MSELVQFSDDGFAALLGTITPAEPAEADATSRHLRERVALLSAFDAPLLSSTKTKIHVGEEEIESFLFSDCERVVARAGPRWSLRGDIRARTLASLDERGRLHAFRGIVDDTDVACRMAVHYIHGTAPPLSEQSVEELQGTAQASEWLRDTSIEVPAPAAAKGRQTVEAMLLPLRALVANGFVGRTRELAELSDYADVLPPTTRVTGAVRRVRRILKMSEKPPLVIHGPGGVGKSTLIAKFVLDHVDAGDVYRFPFAYLSFDRPELSIEQPLTLLADAATQIGALFPHVEADASAFSHAVRSTVAASVASTKDRRAARTSWSASRERTRRDEGVLLERFSSLVESATRKNKQPNVWVLDTFEVAQRLGPTAVDRLWEFLEGFQKVCPLLRVVFAGRVPIEGHLTQDMPLADLDPKSARQLLQLQLADLHLPGQFLTQVAQLVSTHPVSLRVAALFIRSESAGLDTEEGRRAVLFRLRGDQVQGVLYRRILDHIDDPEIRRLAHPGLVVRRLTPEVIKMILAKPCGLANMNKRRARELFERFSREVALVRPDGQGGLVQRPEVRQLMLPMMQRENPDLVRALQRAAVKYYRSRPAFPDRVEELYYRLALGQATSTLDGVFGREAGGELLDVVDEFPASSRVYLLNRLRLSVDPDLLAQADDLSWGRQAALNARRLLDAGDPAGALEQVAARHNDTVLPLAAPLEIEALAALERRNDALNRATQVLDWATEHANAEMFIDVGLLAARIAEDLSQFDLALRWLRAVASSAAGASDGVAVLSAEVAIVRIHRRQKSAGSDEAREVRAMLLEGADRLTARDRARNPSLIRDLAAEIGDEVPSIAQEALRLTGYDTEVPATSEPRKRQPDASKRTSTEVGVELSEVLESTDEGVESVTAKFRADSDQSAI